MASKLGQYQRALRYLNERKLSSLTEDREPRRVLDDAWDDAVEECIEQGFWKFAIRSVQLTYDSSVDPAFGFNYAFEKPDDWVRTFNISEEETFTVPLLNYQDEAGYWWANSTSIYVRYVSNDASYGLNIGEWPTSFAKYQALHLALESAERIPAFSTERLALLEKKEKKALLDARSKDAMNEPPRFPPKGSWASSRGSSLNRSRWNGENV
jgi:hypothetical protein